MILNDLLHCPFVTFVVAVGTGIWSSVFDAEVGPGHPEAMVVSIIDLHVCALWHVTVNALNWGHWVHMVMGGIEIP